MSKINPFKKCTVCGIVHGMIGYSDDFCSERCYVSTLRDGEKAKHFADKVNKVAKDEIEKHKQISRVVEFIKGYEPNYIPCDSTVFTWSSKCDRGTHECFLGRWRRGERYVMGKVVYKETVWAETLEAESLRELERVVNSGDVDEFQITAHNGTKVSWEDFLYYAVMSETNYVNQAKFDGSGDIDSFISSHHSYVFAEGLKP